MSGPVALVTVTDKVCTSCSTELTLENTATAAINTFIDETTVLDTDTQNWSVAAWGTSADRCVSPQGSVCEVLTAKIQRTWSSFTENEDLAFSDGQFMMRLISTDMNGTHEAFAWTGANFITSPYVPPTAGYGLSLIAFNSVTLIALALLP